MFLWDMTTINNIYIFFTYRQQFRNIKAKRRGGGRVKTMTQLLFVCLFVDYLESCTILLRCILTCVTEDFFSLFP